MIIKLIMMLSRFDPGSTLVRPQKTLNLSLLRFNEWSESENLDWETWFKISGSGFIHSNTHLQKAINTVTIRLRDTKIERDSP